MVDATALADLKSRIELLERKRIDSPSNVDIDEDELEQICRARNDVEKRKVYSAVWKFVPPQYYTWSLDQRAKCLNAAVSPYHLTKSLLLENKKWSSSVPSGGGAADPTTNPKYVMVVVQYAATLDNKKLVNAIRSLRSDVKTRIDPNQFDFRIASREDNDRLTGYKHNSVSPFGLLSQQNIPIVLAEAIVPLKFFYMGGGHVHLKLGCAVTEFIDAFDPVVADISQPRSIDILDD